MRDLRRCDRGALWRRSGDRWRRVSCLALTGALDERDSAVAENRDQRSYDFWLTLLLTESYRANAESGAALVFTDWRQLPTTTDALQPAGWTERGIASWHKPVSRPQKGRLKQSCEYIVWGTKGPVDPDRNPVYLPGLYTASQLRKDRVHITQKPVEVMQELVRISPPGGTVLDPFAGSGTTASPPSARAASSSASSSPSTTRTSPSSGCEAR